jgi:hypothetical protein
MSPRGTVTNLALSTNDVTAAPWTVDTVTTAAYGGPFPVGGPQAMKVLTDTAANTTHRVYQASIAVAAGALALASLYFVRTAGTGYIALGANGGGAVLFVDPATGNIGASSTPVGGAVVGRNVESLGGGLYRASLLFVANSLGGNVQVYMANAAGNSVTYANGGSPTSVAFGGVMIEVAAPGQTTPSPYVASGATAGVGRRDARQNYYRFSDDLTKSEHIKNTGVVIVSGSLDVPPPADVPTAAVQKWTYDGSGVAGDYRLYSNAGAIEPIYRNGVPYAWAMWMRVASGTLPLRVQLCANVQAITVTSTWQRFLILTTGNGASGIQPTVFSAVANNAAFTLYTAGVQLVQGSNMPDYIATRGAPANANGAPRSLVI